MCKKLFCQLFLIINGFPHSHVWKDQTNLGEFLTNQSLPYHLKFSLYGSLIPLTPMRDQNKISPDNIVVDTISTRHVVRISKNMTKGIISWSNINFPFTPFPPQSLSCINIWLSFTIYLPLFPNIGKWRRSFFSTFSSVISCENLMPGLNCPLSGLFNWRSSFMCGK